jgi:hypothetical protein
MISFLKKCLKFGDTYGVLDGQYKGHTLIFVKKNGDLYGFCDIFDGKLDIRWISKKDFDFGVKFGILEFTNPQPNKDEKDEIKKIAVAKFNTKEVI